MHIDELLTLTTESIQVPPSWSQGRTIFGGLSCGLVYEKIRQSVPQERILRSLTANFVGPLLTQTDFAIQITILSMGKNVTQVHGQAIQNGKVCLTVQAAFGIARQSNIQISTSSKAELSSPNLGKNVPVIPGVTPEFLQHIEFSIVEGQLPYTASTYDTYKGWMRFKDTPEKLTDTHVLTLIDAWPPTVLQRMKKPAPASTMSWNVEFIHPHPEFLNTEWLGYQAQTRQAGAGYAHVEGDIFSQSGELIALSRQVVTVFD
jgi:acyl-CoA thioesterase II